MACGHGCTALWGCFTVHLPSSAAGAAGRGARGGDGRRVPRAHARADRHVAVQVRGPRRRGAPALGPRAALPRPLPARARPCRDSSCHMSIEDFLSRAGRSTIYWAGSEKHTRDAPQAVAPWLPPNGSMSRWCLWSFPWPSVPSTGAWATASLSHANALQVFLVTHDCSRACCRCAIGRKRCDAHVTLPRIVSKTSSAR